MKRVLTTLLLTTLTAGAMTASAADITVTFKGKSAKVEQQLTDSVSVQIDGANVNIESLYTGHKISVLLKGKSNDGHVILKTAGKAKVTLDGLRLTSTEGAPLWFKNKKKVELTAARGSENVLTIEACRDTALHKAAVIFAKDKLLLTGNGALRLIAQGDGCKGIRGKDDIIIEELALDVETLGNNLGEDTSGAGFPFGPGGFGGPGFPFGGPMGGHDTDSINHQNNSSPFGDRMGGRGGFGGPFGGPMGGGEANWFDPENMSEEDKARMEEMRQRFEEMRQRFANGQAPIFGPRGGHDTDSLSPQNNRGPLGGGMDFPGGFGGPDGPGGPGGFGGFMKHNYVGTTKGIKAQGRVIVNSGTVNVTTCSDGAEGIEGKQGIELNGGTVHVVAVDDAINANDRITFGGAHVTAISTTNDAVDANYGGGFMPFFGMGGQQEQADDSDPMQKAAIVVTGGTVFAWSQRGAPEEGLDCDFAPLAITGGLVFSVGAGMGEMPSVPTAQTATQPTALLTRLDIKKDTPIDICDEQGKRLHQLTVPFDFSGSSSIVSCPQFQSGATYKVNTGSTVRNFTFTEQFVIAR